jgi:hypothetical protein
MLVDWECQMSHTSTLKMEIAGSFKTLALLYQITRHHILEERNLPVCVLRVVPYLTQLDVFEPAILNGPTEGYVYFACP